MAGGGGHSTQTTQNTRDPWSGSQPSLEQALQGLGSAYNKQPSYYGGPLTVNNGNMTPEQQRAWGLTNQFNSSYFSPGGQYSGAVGANNNLLSGGPQGGYAASMAPGTLAGLNSVANMGQYQLGQLGTAGSLDATKALQSELSGTPDYSGLQGSIDAANNPLMRQFNNETLPGLNSKATFMNNSTGGIKSLGTILPDLGQRMSENALGLTEGERFRALAAQQQAASLVTQGGLQQDSQGLQAQQQYANNQLNLGSLLGNYASQASNNQNAGIDNASQLYNLGAMPANAAQAYAAQDYGQKANQLAADQNKFNYLRDAPQQQAQQYANSVLPFANVGGTSSGTSTNSSHTPFGLNDALSTGLGLYQTFGGGLGSMGGGSGLGAAANAAGAAGLTDMSGSAAGNMGSLGGMNMGIGAGNLSPAATDVAQFGVGAAAPGAAGAIGGGAGLGAMGGAGAGASSGLLPGSIAGANMADTAAYTPAFMDATSGASGAGGASAGAGAVAGGVAAGLGAIATIPIFANYMDKHHNMSPQDYLKQWGGQSYQAMQEAAAAHQRGDTAAEKHFLSLAESTKALMSMTQRGLNGLPVGKVTTTHNSGPGALHRSL